MTHLEVENLASDYLEGLLDSASRQAVRTHLEGCTECRELIEEVRRVMEMCAAAEEAEPAPWLVHRILRATLGERKPTLWEQVTAFLRPLVHARVAYPIAMTVFAFSLIVNVTGLNLRHLRFQDLNPRTWVFRANRAGHLLYARAEKYYYDLRLVYEIQSRLKQLRGQSQDHDEAPPATGAPSGGSTEGLPPGQTQLAFAESPAMGASMLAGRSPTPLRTEGPARAARSQIP